MAFASFQYINIDDAMKNTPKKLLMPSQHQISYIADAVIAATITNTPEKYFATTPP